MDLRVTAGSQPSYVFERPAVVWAPTTLDDAVAVMGAVERALDEGYWIAGAISYEFGAQLHGVDARTHSPLLLLGAFERCTKCDLAARPGRFSLSAPLRRVRAEQYGEALTYLLERIRDGEVYQVNYTVPFDAGFAGDPGALFGFLARRARASYCALVEYEGGAIVSISPELFLRFDGPRVTTKPMKGTAPPHDSADLRSEKNRAEHLMIVDLLRNDLHRISDEVDVRRLYEVERYPTFSTMTSTITAMLRPGTTFARVLQAVFPCGSVTGAPKLAAMQHIAQVEMGARGFYTGTIGFLSPQRRGWWNVPIRTLQVDTNLGRARFDAGGGIVSDSDAALEWNEILVKSRFLRSAYADFALLETFRGACSQRLLHAQRLRASAQAFGMPLDVDGFFERAENMNEGKLVRVRLGYGGVAVLAEPLDETPDVVQLCVSRYRVRSDDPFLAHKSVWRPTHEAAAKEAREQGCFDAILQNERGELTEGARTNLFVARDGTLYTPPLHSGVLPGVLRGMLIAENRAVERVLTEADLSQAQAIYAGNSARGLLPARIQ